MYVVSYYPQGLGQAPPGPSTPAGQSSEYCIQALQFFLGSQGMPVPATGKWNIETSQALNRRFGSEAWQNFPGGACALIAALQVGPGATVPGGFFPKVGSSLPFGLTPLTAGIIAGSAILAAALLLGVRKRPA